MLQIAVPSRTDVREYQDLKLEIDQLIGSINGRFTTPNWSPIRYIYGCVSQDELAAFYRDAAVALVTPLRDGMNLVAKEFVACQINTPPGVLIVSPFAGAGEMMHEALICNPYEIDESAEAIHRSVGCRGSARGRVVLGIGIAGPCWEQKKVVRNTGYLRVFCCCSDSTCVFGKQVFIKKKVYFSEERMPGKFSARFDVLLLFTVFVAK